MWVIFIISAWIHLWGWLTGSGHFGLDWDHAVDGWAESLGLAPLVGVELHWGSSLGVDCGVSVGPVAVEMGSLGHLMVSPSVRKSHIWGQCRFTTQLIVYVEPDPASLVSPQLG